MTGAGKTIKKIIITTLKLQSVMVKGLNIFYKTTTSANSSDTGTAVIVFQSG